MIKYRYFPWLGFKKLSDDEKQLYDIPMNLECKALTLEWLSLHLIVAGKVYPKDDDGN